MWLSQKVGRSSGAEGGRPLCGTVTLSAGTVAAFTDAEERGLVVCAPGGYVWRPPVGGDALVLKDPAGTRAYLVAQPVAEDIEPGGVAIVAGEARVELSPGGDIRLTGRVFLNGRELTG